MSFDGFTAREYLEAILNNSLKSSHILGPPGERCQNIKAEDLVRLMFRLELCFERMVGSLGGLFIPTTLAEFEGAWDWPTDNHGLHHNTSKLIHFCRRLQCNDQKCTFIPPGFFC
jgi:hypothetical protein